MEMCQFSEVVTSEDNGAKISWKPFLRQLMVSSGVWASFFQLGLCMGSPTVFIPQLRLSASNDTAISQEVASWLTSGYNFVGIPWTIILSVMTHFAGRRFSFACSGVFSFAAFTVFYFNTSITGVVISELMQGPLFANQMTVCLMVITEYTSPRYRGIFLTIKSASVFWGIWVANAIGTFLHYTNIGLIGSVCALYSALLVIAWPESPCWLASRRRLEACRAAHRWLRGTDEHSEKELEILIQSQNDNTSNAPKNRHSYRESLKSMSSEKFFKPMSITMILITMYNCSGKVPLGAYAIDVLKKITGSESIAYTGMLILDGVTVLGMYIGCVISRYMKRRSLLFTAESIGITTLFTLSLYLYLIKLKIISENVKLSMFLFIAYSLAICCGPRILSTSICGELIPLKSRGLYIFIFSVILCTAYGINIKIAPALYSGLEMHGAFLAYGICSFICVLVLYKYLPETKDRTIKQIEDCFERELKLPNHDHELMPIYSSAK